MATSPAQSNFFVRQAGLKSYGQEGKGAITGYENEDQANDNRDQRNVKAKEMGLDAQYEVIAN